MKNRFLFLLILSLMTALQTLCMSQPVVYEVNMSAPYDPVDNPPKALNNSTNKLNFDTICVNTEAYRRISIRNPGSSNLNVTVTLANLTSFYAKTGFTIAIRKDDGSSFSSNPLVAVGEINGVLNGIPPGGKRDLIFVFKPTIPTVINDATNAFITLNSAVDIGFLGVARSKISNITIASYNQSTKRGKLSWNTVWNYPAAIYSKEKIKNLNPDGTTTCLADGTVKSITIVSNTPSNEFSIEPGTPTSTFILPLGKDSTIGFGFKPDPASTVPVRTGVAKITYDSLGKDGAYYIDLEATVTEGKVVFLEEPTPVTTVDFGKVRLGTTAAKNITIANQGAVAFDILPDGKVQTVSPFAVSVQPPFPATISAGTGKTSFTGQFAPQAAHLGKQSGSFKIQASTSRKAFDSVSATGIGAVPHLQTKLDIVKMGSTQLGTPLNTTIGDFWSNIPSAAIPLQFLFDALVKSVTVTMIQPGGGPAEFTLKNTPPFTVEAGKTMEEIFTFTPAGAIPSVRRALVTLHFDSVGTDNRILSFILEGNVLAPQVSSIENIIDFGEVVTGQNSPSISPIRLLINTGTAVMNVSNPTISNILGPPGFSASAFTVSSFQPFVPVSDSLLPTGLVFSPNVAGEYTATFTISTNAPTPDNILTFVLHGKGIEPGIQSSATTLDFGRVRIGRSQSKTFEISNTATTALSVTAMLRTNPAEFSIIEEGTLPKDIPKQPVSFTAVFSPKQPMGARKDSIIIQNSSPRTPVILLTGEAALGMLEAFISDIAAAPPVSEVDFGKVFVQQQGKKDVYLRNTGTFPYYITKIDLTGANADQFSLTTSKNVNQLNLPGSDSVEIYSLKKTPFLKTMSFFPTSGGKKTATVRVTGKDPVSGQDEVSAEFTVVGNATELGIASDTGGDTLDFGDVLVGTTAIEDGINDRFVRVSNPSDGLVDITSISIVGAPADAAQFRASSRSFSLAISASDTVRVYFSPNGEMSAPATVQLQVIYANGIQKNFTVRGRGIVPRAKLTGVTYTGDPKQKTLSMKAILAKSSTATFTLSNEGSYPLIISSLKWASGGDPSLVIDALPGFTSLTLQSKETHDFTVTFTPSTAGIKTAVLVFTSNHVAQSAAADSSIFTLVINGEGVYDTQPLALTASLPVLNGKPGDLIYIPVSLEGNGIATAGISQVSGTLRFNGKLLAPMLTRIPAASPATGFEAPSYTETSSGIVSFTLDGKSAILTKPGVLFELQCLVLNGDTSATPLEFLGKVSITSVQPAEVATISPGLFILTDFCNAGQRTVDVHGAVKLILQNSQGHSSSLVFTVQTATDDLTILTLYNSLGQAASVPVQQRLSVGEHTIYVDARPLTDGMYYAVMKHGMIIKTIGFVLR